MSDKPLANQIAEEVARLTQPDGEPLATIKIHDGGRVVIELSSEMDSACVVDMITDMARANGGWDGDDEDDDGDGDIEVDKPLAPLSGGGQ